MYRIGVMTLANALQLGALSTPYSNTPQLVIYIVCQRPSTNAAWKQTPFHA